MAQPECTVPAFLFVFPRTGAMCISGEVNPMRRSSFVYRRSSPAPHCVRSAFYTLRRETTGARLKVRFYAHQLSADDAYLQVWAPGPCTLIGEGDSITSDVLRGF